MPIGVVVKQLPPQNLKPFPNCWFETTVATFGGYLPEALARGHYKVAPPPLAVNRKGLEGIQDAIDLMRVLSEKDQGGIKEAMGRMNEEMQEAVKKARLSPIKLVVERPPTHA